MNLLTNVLRGGKKRFSVNNILYDVYDGEFKPSPNILEGDGIWHIGRQYGQFII